MGSPVFHEASDVVVVADEEKDDSIRKLEKDSVLQCGPDFPVILFPVLETQSRGQGGKTVQVVQEGIDGFIGLLPAVGGEFFEPAVEAPFELVLHGYFISPFRCFRAEAES